ncbi:MAG TPA: rhomboid family intramembrane serine protease [Thermoanaerobaculia bacterium]
MILLPIGRDESEIQRHAWISYFVIAANILVFILTGYAERGSRMARIERQWDAAFRYAAERPYLKLPPEMVRLLPAAMQAQMRVAEKSVPRPSERRVRLEQEELDELTGRALKSYHALPFMRFGYIPMEGGILPLLTSMFIHAGFFHLLGNMLFFFASGPFIEDVFGRPLFAFLYIAGGIAATFTYTSRHADSMVPLVGASGAIAAVMGAYLVRFYRSKVEFLFVPFLFRPQLHFRFFLPAFVVLPLWFIQQLWDMSSSEAGTGSGVAFSAHVGGFVFGACLAGVIRLTGFEEKFVRPVVLKQTTWKADDRLVDALAAYRAGDFTTARQQLDAVLRTTPGDVETLRVSLDVARDANDVRTLDAHATRLLGRYIELKDDELAQTMLHDFGGDRTLPPLPKFFARAATYAERLGERAWAVDLYERALEADPNGPNAVPSLVKVGTLLKLNGDLRGAQHALQRAKAHPGCSEEWAPTIDAKLAQLSSTR